MKIRFATPDDGSQLIELCHLHADYEKSDYSSEGKETALLEHLFSNPPALYCLVIEDEGQLIGYATYMKQFSTWDACYYIYMDCLFVAEGNRSKGLGEKIMDRIKEESKALGCDLIQWQTPDFNVRAMKFYDRIGAKSKSKERYFLSV